MLRTKQITQRKAACVSFRLYIFSLDEAAAKGGIISTSAQRADVDIVNSLVILNGIGVFTPFLY